MATHYFTNDGAIDFAVELFPGTANMKIEGLPFALKAFNVILGSASIWRPKRIFPKIRRVKIIRLRLNHVVVDGNMVYLQEGIRFKKRDTIKLFLMGPDKNYDL